MSEKDDRDDILAARAADAMAHLASLDKGKDMSEWEDESGSRIRGCWSSEACIDRLWCIQREMCKKETMKEPAPMTIDGEILALVRHKHEVHDALARLFHSCAPHCIPDENTLHLVNQLSNVIAGYRAADAIENLEKQMTTLLAEQARLAGILSRIAAAAAVYERQVGNAPLVEDIRHGFEKLCRMALQEPGHDQLWQKAVPNNPGERR